MKKTILTLTFCLCVSSMFAGGCGYKESVTTPDRNAFIHFVGDHEGVVAYIDEQGPIDIGPVHFTNTKGERKVKPSDAHYEVDPGKHHIKLMRDGEVILERVILLGNHATQDIEIP